LSFDCSACFSFLFDSSSADFSLALVVRPAPAAALEVAASSTSSSWLVGGASLVLEFFWSAPVFTVRVNFFRAVFPLNPGLRCGLLMLWGGWGTTDGSDWAVAAAISLLRRLQ
jgi:hypothetical protein